MKCPRCGRDVQALTFRTSSDALKPEEVCEECGIAAIALPIDVLGTVTVERIEPITSPDTIEPQQQPNPTTVDNTIPQVVQTRIVVGGIGPLTPDEPVEESMAKQTNFVDMRDRALRQASTLEQQAAKLKSFAKAMETLGSSVDVQEIDRLLSVARDTDTTNGTYAEHVRAFLKGRGKTPYETHDVMEYVAQKTGKSIQAIYTAAYSALRASNTKHEFPAKWIKDEARAGK